MNLYCIKSTSLNPYHNIALEEYLTDTVLDDEVILYLWRNERTVVVGKNQNIYNEYRCSLLKESGGFPARRLSGGGAVYHDKGNVNFSFIAPVSLYSVEKQTSVILSAVQSLGLHAEKSGRNDLTIDGKKFSGNAFFSKKKASCHHGTLLLKTNTEALKKYLTVSNKKFEGKAVKSVRSRVCNLSDFDITITPSKMIEALMTAFATIYGQEVKTYPDEKISVSEVLKNKKKFESDAWLYGKCHVFTNTFEKKFAWGLVTVSINLFKGKITDCVINTDALETEFFPIVASKLCGLPFKSNEISIAFDELEKTKDGELYKENVLTDIRKMIIDELKNAEL
jgi:lipoate-protein ligase A